MKSLILFISLLSFATYAADTFIQSCAENNGNNENNMIAIKNQFNGCDKQGIQVTLVEAEVYCSLDKKFKTIFCLIENANNAAMCYDDQIERTKALAMKNNNNCMKLNETIAVQSTTDVCANGKPVSLVTAEISLTSVASPTTDATSTKTIIYCLIENSNNPKTCYDNQIPLSEASTMIENKSCLPSTKSAAGSSSETVSPK